MLNITQHVASLAQQKSGVFDVESKDRGDLTHLLTFSSLPTTDTLLYRVEKIVHFVLKVLEEMDSETTDVMIGGAPYLMGPLSDHLLLAGLQGHFAYSERISSEDENGVKTSTFAHLGFVKAI